MGNLYQCSLCIALYYKFDKLFLFNTELPKYYVRPQTTVTRGLGWPASRLAGHHTDDAPKCSLLFEFSFQVISHGIDIICKVETLACTDCDYC